MSEIEDLLEAAMYQEVATQAFYIAGQNLSPDAGVKALLQELAAEEYKHLEWLKEIKEKGSQAGGYYPPKVSDMKLGNYLTGGEKLEGAGLQETLIFAIKKEQQSIEFYANMMSVLRDRSAKRLCQRLVRAELVHKYKLETIYDDLYYSEN